MLSKYTVKQLEEELEKRKQEKPKLKDDNLKSTLSDTIDLIENLFEYTIRVQNNIDLDMLREKSTIIITNLINDLYNTDFDDWFYYVTDDDFNLC